MKAISLWQPWATALFLREVDGSRIKPDETRGWPIAYRGPIAIHAAKAEAVKGLDYDPALDEILFRLCGRRTGDLPRGCILGRGQLVTCEKTIKVRPMRSPAQTLWGDYSEYDGNGRRRFAWRINDLELLPVPIPWRGQQGLFDVPDSIFAAVPAAERKRWPDE